MRDGLPTWASRGAKVAAPFIRGAQRRGVEEANRAAAQSVVDLVERGKKLGQSPREAIEQTRDAVSTTYDTALEGVTVPAQQLGQNMDTIFQGLTREHPLLPLEQHQQLFDYIRTRVGTLAQNSGGVLDGPMLKQIDSELGQHVRNLQRSTNAADKTAAPAWRDLQQGVRDALVGALPIEQAAKLHSANAAYRQLLALEKSILPGASSFTPRQLERQLAKAGIKDTDLNTVSNAMTKTLPNTVPDSGTTERLLANALPAMLMGGGYGANEFGYGTLGTGMMTAGALGSRPGARFMTGSLPGQAAIKQLPVGALVNALRMKKDPNGKR